jgi:hypothetical protein
VFERVSGTYLEKIALDSQSGKWVYAADSGTANAMVVTLDPVPAALTSGMIVRVKKSANANTGATTLNVNGLGAKAVKRMDGSALRRADLPASLPFEAIYDSTTDSFIISNFVGNYTASGPFADLNVFSGNASLSVPSATDTVTSFASATIGANADVSLSSGKCLIGKTGRYVIQCAMTVGSANGTDLLQGLSGGYVMKNSSTIVSGVGWQSTGGSTFIKEVYGANFAVLDLTASDTIALGVRHVQSGGTTNLGFVSSMSIARVL